MVVRSALIKKSLLLITERSFGQRVYLPICSDRSKVYLDHFHSGYRDHEYWIGGIGMVYQHLTPDSNARNIMWTPDDEDSVSMAMSSITFPARRILMGDSIKWYLNLANLDGTRHLEEGLDGEDIEKGMFLFFDGSVRLLTEADAKRGAL